MLHETEREAKPFGYRVILRAGASVRQNQHLLQAKVDLLRHLHGLGYRGVTEGVRGLGQSFGAIQTRDIHQARAYAKHLPKYLGLAHEQVKVEAGSGITYVRIKGVAAEPEHERIAEAIERLNPENLNLNALKWDVPVGRLAPDHWRMSAISRATFGALNSLLYWSTVKMTVNEAPSAS